MITIDPDKVCAIIARARLFDADMPLDANDEDPGSDLADDDIDSMEELNEDEDEEERADGTYEETVQIINELPEDEQIELVALAWVGRGSFSSDEWSDALSEAENAHNNRTAEYLLGMPLLADYLEEGLAAFGHSCSD